MFLDEPWVEPAAYIERAHRRLDATSGAAVLAVDLDYTSLRLRYAGVGNVVGRLTDHLDATTLVPQPGIVGHQLRTVRQQELPATRGSLLVLHSDGLTGKWTMASLRGLAARHPAVVAATLMRDAGLRQDDACVVAVRT